MSNNKSLLYCENTYDTNTQTSVNSDYTAYSQIREGINNNTNEYHGPNHISITTWKPGQPMVIISLLILMLVIVFTIFESTECLLDSDHITNSLLRYANDELNMCNEL
jgi:hypothetical protein